jgi:hypothetical protein
MDRAQQLRVAALCYDDTDSVECTLTRAVEILRASGVKLGGLLQRAGERQANGKRRLWLEDIATGVSIRLDEYRGAGSVACVLNSSALADGAVQLRSAIEARPDLIVISRFGAVEAAGGGLRSEIAEAICSGALVVIPLRPALLPDLGNFLGFRPTMLSDDADVLTAWVRGRVLLKSPE